VTLAFPKGAARGDREGFLLEAIGQALKDPGVGAFSRKLNKLMKIKEKWKSHKRGRSKAG